MFYPKGTPLKANLLGYSLNIPISNGKLCLGAWQGICLCEHRDNGGSRRSVVVAVQGGGGLTSYQTGN